MGTPGTTVATTPATTVTTTPVPTCVAFTCPDGFKKVGDAVVCTTGQCDQATCCTYIPTTVTTTPYVPPPTPAPTPAPTPGSPCAPVVPVPVPVPVPTPSSPCETAPPTFRKYDAKEATLAQQAAMPKEESS